jgi:hypothetical protein
MRLRIYFVCGGIFVLCLLFLLSHKHHSMDMADVASTNRSGSFQNTLPLSNRSLSSPQPPLFSSDNMRRRATSETSNEFQERILAGWQVPIDFYGKVLDESNNPVAGADVQFNWDETPTDSSGKTSSTRSDSGGLFELHGARGPSLDVQVSKHGYYTSKGNPWTFSYAINGHFSPDAYNPVIFHLRKKGKGEPLIHIAGIGLHTMRDYSLANGVATDVSLFTGHTTQTGHGDLAVMYQGGLPLENYPSRTTWQFQVTVPNGGLIITDEEYPFVAPVEGYQPADAWNVTATNWTHEVERQYFIKLGNGDFGRVRIRIIGGTRPYFRLESFLNPSGSSNLEFDPNNVIQPSQQ